jgi:hypothetical protein
MKEIEAIPDDGSTDSDLPDRTRRFAEELKRRAAVLTSTAKAFGKMRLRLGEDAIALTNWLDALQPTVSDIPQAEAIRAELLEEWKQVAAEQLLRLENSLRDLARVRGWHVEGQWPDLYIHRGVRVTIDEKKRAITVGHRTLRSLSVDEIGAVLESQITALIPNGFDSRQFIAALARAYDATTECGRTQKSILEVYRAFVVDSQSQRFWRDARAELFTAVTADQFRARLSRALEQGAPSAPDGRELRLLPPLNPKEAMFLYQPSERRFGYVGRVEFVALEAEA